MKHSIILIIFIALTVMMTACSVEPGKDNIKDSIIRHFEARDYKVVDIEIDKIDFTDKKTYKLLLNLLYVFL